MGLKERLEEGRKVALRAGDKGRLSAVRLTLSEIVNAEKDKRRRLEEAEIVQVVRAAVKRREEAASLFQKGGRSDLVEKEMAEAGFLREYLPPELSEGELSELIEEGVAETGASSIRDLGKLMKWIMPRLEGRADGSHVSRLAKEKLSRTS